VETNGWRRPERRGGGLVVENARLRRELEAVSRQRNLLKKSTVIP